MATADEVNAAILAKGEEIRTLKTNKAEKDEVMAKVAELSVSNGRGDMETTIFIDGFFT